MMELEAIILTMRFDDTFKITTVAFRFQVLAAATKPFGVEIRST